MGNSAIETAYYDLCGIAYLIRLKDNKKFSKVPVYSLARDACLIIYQINKEIFNNEFTLHQNIKNIRHKVKLYNKGNNRQIYENILQNSIKQFGDDVDNIGLFIENDMLVGSTIFQQYLFIDTNILESNPRINQRNALEFFKYVGATAYEFSVSLEGITKSNVISFELLPTFNYSDDSDYSSKDIHHSQLYKEEESLNIIITRLLLILQETTFCLWLSHGVRFDNDDLTIDIYITLRLISIKSDEVMDNLLNMKKFLKEDFDKIDQSCNQELSNIIEHYNIELKDECKILRNFLHYNFKGENFLDYVIKKTKENPDYSEEIVEKINHGVMKPLSKVLSHYFEIDRMKSMSEWEKIRNRIITLSKKAYKRKI
ncbi:DNA polymerase III subunit gamma/tau [Salipaludibacillus neizhouensis]|uniref:DNA polymerase III subunit gamma/tau n=1 Tax=Salipaludibacillus neizhouensis TaxID=885475 RepID=A0A3A9K3F1_9BACI|nr:DNA polymerase III subunit gamma/tau [Salipaludibacillus neizhouensis]RKL65798.1 DNA polymerase III subunit gamma/tau [Salipaludibacillus neizhouensis]